MGLGRLEAMLLIDSILCEIALPKTGRAILRMWLSVSGLSSSRIRAFVEFDEDSQSAKSKKREIEGNSRRIVCEFAEESKGFCIFI